MQGTLPGVPERTEREQSTEPDANRCARRPGPPDQGPAARGRGGLQAHAVGVPNPGQREQAAGRKAVQPLRKGRDAGDREAKLDGKQLPTCNSKPSDLEADVS